MDEERIGMEGPSGDHGGLIDLRSRIKRGRNLKGTSGHAAILSTRDDAVPRPRDGTMG